MCPIIRAKLSPPILPRRIGRPRPLALLREGAEARLALLRAPAGSGKTALAAERYAELGDSAAWLTLDGRDASVGRLIRYMAAAIGRLRPDSGLAELAETESDGYSDPDAWLVRFSDAIASAEAPAYLFLDDFDHLVGGPGERLIADLIRWVEGRFSIAICARREPGLPLRRLGAEGRLLELGFDELRFDRDEIARALATAPAGAGHGAVEAVYRRSGGWPAWVGMGVAARLREGGPEAAPDEGLLLAYVRDELLEGLEPQEREAALRLAPLEQVCADMAEGLIEGGASALRRLCATGLVAEVSDGRHRFHPPLVMAMRSLRAESDRASLLDDYVYAATWYHKQGAFDDEAGFLLLAGKVEAAADLMEEAAIRARSYDELRSAVRHAGDLTRRAKESRPRLCAHAALAALAEGELEGGVNYWLDLLRRSPERRQAMGEADAFEAIMLLLSGDAAEAYDRSCIAISLIARDRLLFRALALGVRAAASIWDARPMEAIDSAEEAATIGRELGNAFIESAAYRRLLEAAAIAGDRERADLAYRAYVADGRIRGGQSRGGLPFDGLVHAAYAEILLLGSEPANAKSTAERAVGLLEGWPPYALAGPYLAFARSLEATGEQERADRQYALAATCAAGLRLTSLDERYVAVYAARRALRAKSVEALGRWALSARYPDPRDRAQGGFKPGRGPALADYHERLVYAGYAALVLEREGQEGAPGLRIVARKLRDLCRELDGRSMRPLSIEARARLSLVLRKLGDPGWTAELGRALAQAEATGITGPLMELGSELGEVLHSLPAGSPGLAIRRLIETAGRSALAGIPETSGAAGTEISPVLLRSSLLSARELEVLRLVDRGFSNKELADTLCISLPTVKWHLSNAYEKLGARSRVGALARARALGLGLGT